jgi:hypothetical protein
LSVFIELLDRPNVGRIDGLGENAAHGAIVMGESRGSLGMRKSGVNDVAHPRCVKVHVKDPAPLEVVGVWTRRLKFVNGV